MNKEQVKEQLNEYRWIKKNINVLTNTLIELEAKQEGQSPLLSTEPRGSEISDRTGNAASSIADLKDLIKSKIDQGAKAIKKIENMIDTLPEREQCLLRLRYVKNLEWEAICIEMSYGWSRTHQIHSDALDMICNHKHRTQSYTNS